MKTLKATLILFIFACLLSTPLIADNKKKAAKIDREVDHAVLDVISENEAAMRLIGGSSGVLVFPSVIKAGLVIGGQYGEGALRIDGVTKDYYNTVAASYGLQIGGQKFGFMLVFMNDEAMGYLDNADGWEVGFGPSVVVVDQGMAKSLTTATANEDVYVFFFDQQGLMAGMGVQGSKITKMDLSD
ncbi:MAG: YSC84-related protein [Pseudomonadota bacterium]